ncbi:SDR family oxidoreductase [Frankia sp. CNm7]|uniref:SDR family oxidoreductase n=1 Tax=Frankia nepalensis TaxID=1836974 RepID=A0A937RK34_9ACTN|nr:SDR family oxidoreductase [Frankia nepalensis]MBL7496647.1 SDR family oxidoreductase [Frankia nepalensis]MBL7511905.1 SDR family oxidoreductase [Frankia nepalensis]MBL7516656.1 SDR family oxidoreductase [Frankia nepalensis]MBL7627386.1 SDR family oxidoreductase [Frankia nepalensis]
MQRLEGETIIVTGGTGGIGEAIALRAAEEGGRVMVTGRRQAEGDRVVDLIRAAGGQAAFTRADISVEADVAAAVDATVREFGPPTVLVNNAAPTDLVGPGNRDGRLTDVTTENFEEILRVGLYGAYWMSRYAIPHMQAAGHGSIVNVSSAAGVKASPRVFGYAVAKGGLQALTRSVAVDYAVDNIRANTIIVGFVVSNPLAERFAADESMSAAMRLTHITRFGTPADIAAAAVFLASSESEFMTGSDMYADGGCCVKQALPGTRAEARRVHAPARG